MVMPSVCKFHEHNIEEDKKDCRRYRAWLAEDVHIREPIWLDHHGPEVYHASTHIDDWVRRINEDVLSASITDSPGFCTFRVFH
jgi:hypothetical protein